MLLDTWISHNLWESVRLLRNAYCEAVEYVNLHIFFNQETPSSILATWSLVTFSTHPDSVAVPVLRFTLAQCLHIRSRYNGSSRGANGAVRRVNMPPMGLQNHARRQPDICQAQPSH